VSTPAPITCPGCGLAVATVYVQAPAVVETRAIVSAEVELGELGDVYVSSQGRPLLLSFRLDDVIDTVDGSTDWRELELGDSDLSATCGECGADLTDELKELLP
jgi:hypothetical protein